MPTSTLWRRTVADPSFRGVSPERPSGDAIERISPEPSFPPTFSSAYPFYSPPRDHGYVQGLGLSYDDMQGGGHSRKYSRELYVDRHGAARVTNRAPDANDSPQQPFRQNRNLQSRKGRGHTRSGSTLDDLANASAAIDTTTTYTNGSPGQYYPNGSPTSYTSARPATSHLAQHHFTDDSYGPPAKRVKSERLPAMEWEKQPSRPSTSGHLTAMPTTNAEAELLLFFKNQGSPVPPNSQLHYSPSQQHHTIVPPAVPQSETNRDHFEYNMPTASDSVRCIQNLQTYSHTYHDDSATTLVNGVDTELPEAGQPSDQEQKNVLHSERTMNVGSAPYAGELPTQAPKEPKKPRRVPVESEYCAECGRVQRATDDEDITTSWIQCNGCNKWFHAACAGFRNKAEARGVDKFFCKKCEPEHGKTTFVRKSSRARTAIDYAGLNQGLVKSSAETSMHHYIQPIKTGKFVIQKDDFARIRPELLTVDLMESFDNMKRPFVVPACWNPRFGAPRLSEEDQPPPDSPRPRYTSSGEVVQPETAAETLTTEEVIDCDQDLLDMVMPKGLTVRKVAELYGPHELVPVIDVKSQETKGTWSLAQWADYYEEKGDKPVRNVISLEVSHSKLGRLIRRPKVVRDLDLEDMVWDAEQRSAQKKKYVQYYCLMSVADSYTDFHIDFGGSSVYYHILKGTKTFFFIPPTPTHLKKYEEWCNSNAQNDTWLPDMCNGNVTRVDLHEGDTAFIPAGWIHSVWTPEDSLVIGGNFLTRIDYDLQIKVANVEKATKVAPKFRYPFFQKVMWYTLIKYLEDDPVPQDLLEQFQDNPDYIFLRANHVWQELGDLENNAEPDSHYYNARYYPKSEITGLPALRDYLYRTARIYNDLLVPDINKKQIEAVKASVPKGHGDPMTLMKTFAIWCAWKIGNETVPEWVYSDEAGGFPELTEKKSKKAEKERSVPERVSERNRAIQQAQAMAQNSTADPASPTSTTPKASTSSSGLRSACEACRKRRIRCKHREVNQERESSRSQSPRALAPKEPLPNGQASTENGELESSIAQAALAVTDTNGENGQLPNGLTPPSGKKTRRAACEECRKSKRRCVHDEFGRIDPAKAAEPSKPRGSNAKRPSRPSDEGGQVKRPRIDSVGSNAQDNLEAMIDPALFAADDAVPEQSAGGATRTGKVTMTNGVDGANVSQEPDGVSEMPEAVQRNGIETATGTKEEVLATTEADDDQARPIKAEATNATPHILATPSADKALTLNESAVDDSSDAHIVHTPDTTILKKQTSVSISPEQLQSQRHSSRQHKEVERYVPGEFLQRSPSKSHGLPRRASSVNTSTEGMDQKRRSSSNVSAMNRPNGLHSMAVNKEDADGRPASSGKDVTRPGTGGRESTTESLEDADEKFARELQMQELGLRRRRSSVVR